MIDIKLFDWSPWDWKVDLLLSYITNKWCNHCFYRWVKKIVLDDNKQVNRDESYKLIPTLWRLSTFWTNEENYELEDALQFEYDILQEFRKRIIGITNNKLKDDIQLMSMWQHYGLPTRLLDRSSSPLQALYFAVQPVLWIDGQVKEHKSENAGLYRIHTCDYISDFDREFRNPRDADEWSDFDNWLNISKSWIMYPEIINNRLLWQQWVFSIHRDPTKPFELEFLNDDNWNEIELIIIWKWIIRELQERLFKLWIRHSTVYPDLDWLTTDIKNRYAFRDFCTH